MHDEEEGAEPPPPPPPPIPVPDPASLEELTAMGFPEQLSRNALLLHRNRLQPAVEWALTHVDDAQAMEPLTDEALAAVYGPGRALRGAAGLIRRRPRLPPGQVDPAALDSMVEMGFGRDDSARALAFTSNSLEDACQLILSGMPLPPLPEQVAIPADEAGAAGEGSGGGVAAATVAVEPGEGSGGAAVAGGVAEVAVLGGGDNAAIIPPEEAGAAAGGGGDGADPDEGMEEESSDDDDDDDEDDDDEGGAWEYQDIGVGPMGVGDVNIDDLEMMYGGGGAAGEWIGYSDDEDEDEDEDDEYEDFDDEYSDGEAMEEQEPGADGAAEGDAAATTPAAAEAGVVPGEELPGVAEGTPKAPEAGADGEGGEGQRQPSPAPGSQSTGQ